jgi:hypothetical protein
MGPGHAAAPGDRLVAVRLWPVAVLGAVLALAAPPASAAPPPVRSGAPISAHAMVHTCCTPLAMKERIFAEAKAMGARFIRVDVELNAIFPAEGPEAGAPDWSRLDDVLELSRRHELPVLGILLSPPGWLAPDAAEEFARLAAQVAAHARDTVVHWEILNEPNAIWGFSGTPEDYARLLRATHDAIAARVPEASVVLGGVMVPHGPAWLGRVFATPGADAVHAFDIAAVNLRDSARRLPGQLAAWRAMLAGHGFSGPLWVTEHGYPADAAFQTDPAFRGGETAQAAFLTEAVLGLTAGGADEVFVTAWDNVFLRGTYFQRFLTEGVVAIADEPPYAVRRKPAFGAMRRLVDNWSTLASAYSERRAHEDALRNANAQVAAAVRQLRRQRALARAVAARLARLQARHRRAYASAAHARLGRRVARATLRLRERRSHVGWAKALTDHYRLRAALHHQRALELAAFVAGG